MEWMHVVYEIDQCGPLLKIINALMKELNTEIKVTNKCI